ncbi:MAG: DUF3987 domain-containing protein [Deltaproteobacteria bacterium]|nr:DUF3987 domain-containing protein [Deltaproteobacteria bacterium]
MKTRRIYPFETMVTEKKPTPLDVVAEKIPPELQAGRHFVTWSWTWRPGKNGKPGKWDKPPTDVKTGKLASSTDPSTWCLYAEVLRHYFKGKCDGIGRVIASPFVGVDLDDCRDPKTGHIERWAQKIIDKLNSYTEVSPSRRGVKIWAKGTLPKNGRRRCGKIEMYDGERYFTITGHHLATTPWKVEERTKEILELYSELFSQKRKKRPRTPATVHICSDSKKALAAAMKDEKFKRLWAGDTSGYPSQSEADQALCNKLCFYVGPDFARIDSLFRQSGLYRAKWNREDYRNATINNAVATVTEYYRPREGKKERQIKPQKLDFPSWVMAGLAGEFSRLYSSYLEVPAHFFYMTFLTCLGSVLSDSLSLASEIGPQPRLYTLLLGESADDRKSTALNKVVDFFKWSVDGFSVCWGVGSAEGLQKRLEDSRKLLLCFDEFKQFVSKCKIEASVLLPCVNTLFEANRYESRTKKTDIRLEDVFLSLVAASTLETYENTWSSQFTDIGFNNRLFLVPGTGERRFSFPAKIPDSQKYLLKQKLAEVLRHVGDGLELDLTARAKKLYHNWYVSLERSVYTKRLDGYAMRLMSLLSVNELKPEIDSDIIKKVVALCGWQHVVRAIYDPIDADNAIAEMEEKIRRVLKAKGAQKDRELKQSTNARRKGLWAYNTAKKNLISSNEVGFNRKQKTYFLRG